MNTLFSKLKSNPVKNLITLVENVSKTFQYLHNQIQKCLVGDFILQFLILKI